MSAPASRYLLDTSALLTLLEDEAGAERVQIVLKNEHTLISSLSLLEVRYITLQEQTTSEADLRHALLKRSGAVILWDLDEPLVLKAAAFKAAHAVSLADAVIAATAQRHQAILLHKDPEFEALVDEVQLEALPAKAVKRNKPS